MPDKAPAAVVCEGDVACNDEQKGADGGASAAYTAARVFSRDSNWAAAVAAGGLSPRGAWAWATLRLLWLAGPPSLFLSASFSFMSCEFSDGSSGAASSSQMPVAAGGLALVVDAWFAICLLAALVSVACNPAILLVDIAASIKDSARKDATGGCFFLFVFVCESDMFCLAAIEARLYLGKRCCQAYCGTSWYTFWCVVGGLLELMGTLLLAAHAMDSDGPQCEQAWASPVLTVSYFWCLIGVVFKMIHMQMDCFGKAHEVKDVERPQVPREAEA